MRMGINLKMRLLVKCCAQGTRWRHTLYRTDAHGNKPEDALASWTLLCARVYVPDGDARGNKPEDVLDSWMLLCAGGVYRAEKHTGANLKMLVQGLSTRPMGIVAYSASRQKCERVVVTCLCTAATSALDPVTMILFSFGIIMIVKCSADKRYKITRMESMMRWSLLSTEKCFILFAVGSDFLFTPKELGGRVSKNNVSLKMTVTQVYKTSIRLWCLDFLIGSLLYVGTLHSTCKVILQYCFLVCWFI